MPKYLTLSAGALFALTAVLGQTSAHSTDPGFSSDKARQSENQLKRILEIDPADRDALMALARMNSRRAAEATDPNQMSAGFAEARRLYNTVLEATPKDKYAYLGLANTVSREVGMALVQARAQLGIKVTEPGPLPDANVRGSLEEKYASLLEDGIASATKALEIDPALAAAMSQLAVLLRERASLADTASSHARDIEASTAWRQKAGVNPKLTIEPTLTIQPDLNGPNVIMA